VHRGGRAPRETLFQLVGATNVLGAIAYVAVYARGGWKRARER
jgi:hypothetical protein